MAKKKKNASKIHTLLQINNSNNSHGVSVQGDSRVAGVVHEDN